MKQLIGLAAAARSGKDTVADYLVENMGYVKYSLASPIKDFFDSLFNWGMEYREGEFKDVECQSPTIHEHELMACLITFFPQYELSLLFEKFNAVFDQFQSHYVSSPVDGMAMYHYDMSPRVAYQLFGTEFGRSLSETIWLDLAANKFDQICCEANPEVGGMVIPDIRFQNEVDFIRNNGGHLIHISRDTKQEVASHASEGGIDIHAQDYRIDNNGTYQQLFQSVRAIIHSTNELSAQD